MRPNKAVYDPRTGGAACAATCVVVLIYLGIWDYLRTECAEVPVVSNDGQERGRSIWRTQMETGCGSVCRSNAGSESESEHPSTARLAGTGVHALGRVGRQQVGNFRWPRDGVSEDARDQPIHIALGGPR